MDQETAAGKIIVALDVDNEEEAYNLVRHLSPPLRYFKVGLRLYMSCGPRIIYGLKNMGVRIFLDLKFHDIPNTVAATAEVVTRMGVDMFNIHLSGGRDMIRTTVDYVRNTAAAKRMSLPSILGVTVLSSFDEVMLRGDCGVSRHLEQHVLDLALLGEECGLDGVVASPREARNIRKNCGAEFLIVAAGVRPLWAPTHDQLRVLTPRQALEAGANYLVIGRPIIDHESPRAAAEKILAEIAR